MCSSPGEAYISTTHSASDVKVTSWLLSSACVSMMSVTSRESAATVATRRIHFFSTAVSTFWQRGKREAKGPGTGSAKGAYLWGSRKADLAMTPHPTRPRRQGRAAVWYSPRDLQEEVKTSRNRLFHAFHAYKVVLEEMVGLALVAVFLPAAARGNQIPATVVLNARGRAS
jgi:hypothetical protein